MQILHKEKVDHVKGCFVYRETEEQGVYELEEYPCGYYGEVNTPVVEVSAPSMIVLFIGCAVAMLIGKKWRKS